MKYDAVPKELRDLPQWLGWRLVERSGRTTKVPCRAQSPSQSASTTDPATWSGFDAAVAAAEVDSSVGIGFVFTAQDPYVGIDIDKAVAENGQLHPTAARLVEELDGYAEWSPSGNGLHIIVRGVLPGGRGRRTTKVEWGGAFEIYDRGRYFTVTGKAVS